MGANRLATTGARILAQAMEMAPFEDVRRLETVVGADTLADLMLHAEPGWLSDRSWEFWRGRLALATAGRYLRAASESRSMRRRFEPRLDILPAAQKKLWPLLEPARRLGFVLYGGTAVALHLGHRSSIDFDFFRSQPLAKRDVEQAFAFMPNAETLQESENTLVVAAQTSHGSV